MDDGNEFLYFSDALPLDKNRFAFAMKRNKKHYANGFGKITAETIPAFSLYGETTGRPDDEFVHVEEIVTRSQHHGWEIDRHVHHGLCQILVVFSGGVDLRLDDVESSPAAPCAVVVPPSTVHAFRFRPGTEGRVLTFAEARFTAADAVRRGLVEDLFARPAVVDLTDAPDRAAPLRTGLDLLAREFAERAPGWTSMIEWQVSALLLVLARRRASAMLAEAGRRPEADLFARFRPLVEAHFAAHHPVSWFADALGVTESRLDRAARAVAGRSAFEVLQDRLLLEARRKLVYIAAPVSKLAYELGFDDPAYFWRFFRRRTGMTPSEFRRAERRRAEGTPSPD